MARCLVVEDRPRDRELTRRVLERAGHRVWEAGGCREALRIATEVRPAVVVLDLGLPDGDGLSLIPSLRAVVPMARVVVLTGRDGARDAVAALKAGAAEYLVKPWTVAELLSAVGEEDRHGEGWADEDLGVFWGAHPEMARIRARILKLGASPWTPVLIEGETGTGKEVVARAIHRATPGSQRLVALNCAAVPAELLESELFGHERGAFTGADAPRRGLAELADGGTLLLDEIGEMRADLQAKLLRFLEDRTLRRVGGRTEIRVRCRLVGATQVDLSRAVDEGAFRADLFYRLAVVRLHIPPLRERREDLLPLARWLLHRIAARLGVEPRPLTSDAERALLMHDWPGNVRELRNRLERALVLGEGLVITPEELELPGRATCTALLDDAATLEALMAQLGWNVSHAARVLGVPRHRLRYRLAKYGLQRPAARSADPAGEGR